MRKIVLQQKLKSIKFSTRMILITFSVTAVIPLTIRGRDISEIVEAKTRNAVSDRATAAIVNATLRAYNIPEVIGRSKIRRETDALFEEIEEAPTICGGGIGYDGRKDATLMQEEIKG